MERLRQIIQKKESLKRAEAMCTMLETDEHNEVALIPAEANFQLPDIFLSTRILPECETYFIRESTVLAPPQVEAWNSNIGQALEALTIHMSISPKDPPKHLVTEEELVTRIEEVLGG
ncbi:hypothetical protein NEDG_00703 [Nematocida displodere]|uniref:Uncharacterized protein n=1 Tax=Nematocida displodere TaxID=1805483 RepID=A0A177EDU7_9MICR|nr:hypothetical protein NEDG_00703 [Nematocida displodere]